MKIGPLLIGWCPITERERIDFGLDPWIHGWEALCIEWNGRGFTTVMRPVQPKVRRG